MGSLALAGADPHYRAAAQRALKGLDAYWAGDAYASYVVDAGGGDRYTDDNAWIALALIQAYRMGLSSDLKRTAQVLRFAARNWDQHGAEPAPGGIFWVEQRRGLGLQNHDRGAGTTAGHAAVGLHLAELGYGRDVAADPDALLDWVSRYLDSSHSGAGPFWNAIRHDGSIDTNVWIYNQGVMLAARVLQYRLSADPACLRAAQAIAARLPRTFGDLRRQPPSFNTMCVQHLLLLHAVAPDPDLLRLVHDYADWTWSDARARDPETNLFYFDDAARPALRSGQPAKLQDQGALLQLYALLAWPPQAYAALA